MRPQPRCPPPRLRCLLLRLRCLLLRLQLLTRRLSLLRFLPLRPLLLRLPPQVSYIALLSVSQGLATTQPPP